MISLVCHFLYLHVLDATYLYANQIVLFFLIYRFSFFCYTWLFGALYRSLSLSSILISMATTNWKLSYEASARLSYRASPNIAIYVELSMSNEIQISSSILLFIDIYYAYLSLFDVYIRWQQLLAVLWA